MMNSNEIGSTSVAPPNAAHGSALLAGSTLDGRDPLADAVVSFGMQFTYLVVKARKGTGPIIEALEKAKKRKATSFPPCTMRIQGPAGGGHYAGTLLVQLGEPGTEDENRGRLTREDANRCGEWLVEQRAISSFEIYRPDLLLDAQHDDLSRQSTALTYDTFQSETPTLRYAASTTSHEPLVK